MSRQILVHDEARFDVIDIAYAIGEDNFAAADGFVEAIDDAYEQLADLPGMGAPREYGNPRLTGMRMWPVPGFQKYLIFYRANEAELRVFRVLHGARDIEHLFRSGDATP